MGAADGFGAFGDRMPNAALLSETLGVPQGLISGIASAVPGLSSVNAIGNVANTAMNAHALGQMGYSMTPA